MKAICSFFVILLLQEAIGGVVKNPPAFSKPVYTDSYLPAAMQVIFHAVEQLKLLQSEEKLEGSTSTVPPKHECQTAYDQTDDQEASTVVTDTTTNPSTRGKNTECGSRAEEVPKGVEISTKSSEISNESTDATSQAIEDSSVHQEAPEVNEETPELNYATPEANYEAPEDVHGVQEANQEIPEENQGSSSMSIDARTPSITETNATVSGPTNATLDQQGSIDETKQKKKEPTVDTVIQEVYEIVKSTPSVFLDEDAVYLGESKSATPISVEKTEIMEDEDDENRFTRLGEKVTQVPRPSLTSYLRRSNVPPSATLQQLASLYDSLSKDARKQGYGKYTGYSDEVLNTLMTSVEGGIAPQLKNILDKVLERNELTRDDAKIKTNQTIQDLDNPSSTLSKEMRPLLPLRYSP
ncbi:ecdysone-inducible gene E3 isoform X1 [Colletes latitarsis]|uniref:ecdysone-inducible gene E3 isoform X1 n=2 Tax=Colletes latitarsis TaxID=2605962 RepID=UPI004035A8D0